MSQKPQEYGPPATGVRSRGGIYKGPLPRASRIFVMHVLSGLAEAALMRRSASGFASPRRRLPHPAHEFGRLVVFESSCPRSIA